MRITNIDIKGKKWQILSGTELAQDMPNYIKF